MKKTPSHQMWLGLSTLLSGPILGINAAVLRPFIDQKLGEAAGIIITLAIVLGVFTYMGVVLVKSLKYFLKGQRSWQNWLGLIPAAISAAFWLFMLGAEIFFPEH